MKLGTSLDPALMNQNEETTQPGAKAEVKCPICKTTLAVLDNATFQDAAKLFKEHLPTHTLTQIYELITKTAQLKYPDVEWDYAKKK